MPIDKPKTTSEPSSEPSQPPEIKNTFETWVELSGLPHWLTSSAKFCNGWRLNSELTKTEFDLGIEKARGAKLWQLRHTHKQN